MSNQGKLRVTKLYKGGDGRWVYTAEKLPGVQSQSVLREDDTEFPMARVQKWLEDETRLVSYVGYGDKTWVVVVNRMDTSETKPPKQEIFISVDFPQNKISEAWENNYKVRILTYCNDKWILVTEKNREVVVGQTVVTLNDIEDVKTEIRAWWNSNKAVHSLYWGKVKGEGSWVMLSQQMSSVPGQVFTANSDWPLDKIGEHFKNGKYITCLAYHPTEEFWVVISGPIPGGQSMATTETFPYAKLKTLEDIYLYGVRE